MASILVPSGEPGPINVDIRLVKTGFSVRYLAYLVRGKPIQLKVYLAFHLADKY